MTDDRVQGSGFNVQDSGSFDGPPLRILVAHNHYQQPGGEDQSVAAEAAMLRDRGHQVIEYSLHNDAIDRMTRVGAATRAVWNRAAYKDLRRLIRSERPDIAHFNNTFPLISPAGYYAARAERVPVVQTLRNYRLLCANSFLFRGGTVCTECLSRALPWPGVVHKCYRNSRSASTAVAVMLTVHRSLGTWHKAVDAYIALTEFSRGMFIAAGLASDRITVKPNFVYPDPGPGTGQAGYAVFVGRLSEEKGLETHLTAWESLHGDIPLKIAGDGPMNVFVQRKASSCAGIEWLGRRSPSELDAVIGNAAFLVFPSQWYETFGRVAIEAFAKGTPVVASRLGAMAELVDDGRTGVTFESGNPADLVMRVRRLLQRPERLREMRRAARAEYEERYTIQRNYGSLMAIYQAARVRARRAEPQYSSTSKYSLRSSQPL